MSVEIVPADPATIINQRIEMRIMSPGQLRVDPGYQRNLDEVRAERMAERWSPLKAQMLIVSARENNQFVVIDGQHRHAAAKMARAASLHCLVLWGLTPEQEAELFEAYNADRVPVHIIDRFKAALFARDKTALKIQAALEAADLRIEFKTSPQTTSAVGALEILSVWGALPMALDMVTSAWPENSFSRNRTMLMAVGSLDYVYRDEGLDEGRLVSILRQRAPQSMVEEAMREAEFTVGRRKGWAVVAENIVSMYNRGLAKPLKLPAYEAPEIPSKNLRFVRDKQGVGAFQRRKEGGRQSAAQLKLPG